MLRINCEFKARFSKQLDSDRFWVSSCRFARITEKRCSSVFLSPVVSIFSIVRNVSRDARSTKCVGICRNLVGNFGSSVAWKSSFNFSSTFFFSSKATRIVRIRVTLSYHVQSQKSCEVLDGVDSRDRREVVEPGIQQYRQQRLFLPFVAVCLKSERRAISVGWLGAEANGVSVRNARN